MNHKQKRTNDPCPANTLPLYSFRRAVRFAAIETVGVLLPADLLARIAATSAPSQSAASYGIDQHLSLRDESPRFYKIA